MKIKKANMFIKKNGLQCVAMLALAVTTMTSNVACMWFFGQGKMPKNYKKLRKF